MSRLEIIELKTSVTIQDNGRTGFQRYGVPIGGAMDRYALAEGRALLGNDSNSAALEMPFYGGTFRATDSIIIAITGAEMDIQVNGKEYPSRKMIKLEKDQILHIGSSKTGVYGYLHLYGGISTYIVLGSRSTHIQSKIGWLPNVGDFLVGTNSIANPGDKQLPEPDYFQRTNIRIITGPQTSLFDKEDIEALETAQFKTTITRDRMGVKLSSTYGQIQADQGLKLISDPIIAGDIQIAADGTASVLLADSQPIGGYPRIASIIGADLHVIAQLPPDREFSMEFVNRKQAVKAYHEVQRKINSLPAQLIEHGKKPTYNSDLLNTSLISGVIRGDEYDID